MADDGYIPDWLKPQPDSDLVFGLDTRTKKPVRLAHGERTKGLYVVGKSGTGKSTLLEQLILQDLDAGRGVCVLDPHGQLIERLIDFLPTQRVDDVILLVPGFMAFGLNLYHCPDPTDDLALNRVRDQVLMLFKKLWGEGGSQTLGWGAVVEEIVSSTAITLTETGLTLAELTPLLLDADFRKVVVARMRNEQVRKDFWERRYNTWREDVRDQRINSTINKVQQFLTNPILYRILGQQTTIDFGQVMQKQQVVLCYLPVGQLGEQTVSLLGSVIIQQLLNAALSRKTDAAPFYLYADEYHRFETPAFATLIDEARKYNVATTMTHQRLSQLSGDREAPLAVHNFVIFQAVGADAQKLADNLDIKPQREVVGYRPKRMPSLHPVEDLLQNPHEDDLANGWTQVFLLELWKRSRSLPEDHYAWQEYGGLRRYYYKTEDLRRGLDELNSYFLAMMHGQISPGDPEEIGHLLGIIEALRGWMGFDPNWTVMHREPRLKRFPLEAGRALARILYWYISKFPDEGDNTPEWLCSLGFNAIQLSRYKDDDPIFVRFDQDPKLLRHILTKGADALPLEAMRELVNICGYEEFEFEGTKSIREASKYTRLFFKIDLIMYTGRVLARMPILVNSSEVEPDEREESIDNARNRVVNRLANLPLYTAHCKLGGKESTIGVEPIKGRTQLSSAEQVRIKEQTIERYCTTREKVGDLVKQRQLSIWRDAQRGEQKQKAPITPPPRRAEEI